VTRRAVLGRLVVGLLAALAVLLPADPSAWAQDGGKKKKDGDDAPAAAEEEAPPEKTAEQKTLEAIGEEFAAKDVDALFERVKAKDKIRLSLGQYDKLYGRSQAKESIEAWFASRTIVKVKFKPSKDTKSLTGTFKLKFRRRKDEDVKTVELEIRIKKDGDGFALSSIRVMPR
jgi:hypothetical protein